MKKIIPAGLLLLCIILSIITKLSLKENNRAASNRLISITPLSKEDIASEDDLKEEIDGAYEIVIGEAVDDCKIYSYNVISKVKIKESAKGKVKVGDVINISSNNGFFNEKNSDFSGILQKGTSYLLVLSYEPGVGDGWFNRFFLETMALSDERSESLEYGQKYTPDYLKTLEYITNDQDVLGLLYDRKEFAIKYIQDKYHWSYY